MRHTCVSRNETQSGNHLRSAVKTAVLEPERPPIIVVERRCRIGLTMVASLEVLARSQDSFAGLKLRCQPAARMIEEAWTVTVFAIRGAKHRTQIGKPQKSLRFLSLPPAKHHHHQAY